MLKSTFREGALHVHVARRTVMAQNTQLVVIGAGPGGYAAAFYAADLGMQVTLVDPAAESRRRLPLSRLHPVEGAAARRQARRARRSTPSWGVTFGAPKIDLDRLRGFKDKVVRS